MVVTLAGPKREPRSGIDSLDEAHRCLVRLCVRLCDDCEKQRPDDFVAAQFAALHTQASRYFFLEERLMQNKGSAFTDAHTAEHERLLDGLRRIAEAFEDGTCNGCGASLRTCIEIWLADHMRSANAALRTLAK